MGHVRGAWALRRHKKTTFRIGTLRRELYGGVVTSEATWLKAL